MKSTFIKLCTILALFSVSQLALSEATTKSFTDIEKYNAYQKNKADQFYINEKPQVGDTCVCHVMNNLAVALGTHKSDAQVYVQSCTGKQIFVSNMNKFSKDYPGEIFGGLSLNFTKPKTAIAKIEQSLDDGKVIAVSLDPRPIYDEYVAQNHVLDYEHNPKDHIFGVSHALVVIAQERNQTGDVEYFWLADSSGPKRKYRVSVLAFYESYINHLATKLNRGVYIPTQASYQAARYILTY